MLADANGLTNSDETLAEGQNLQVPQVGTNTNSASTFKPYDPSEQIGPTAPSLPTIAPPPKNSCNPIAQLLMVIVAVVVTIYTAGAAAGALTSGAVTTGATGATVAAGASTMQIGAAVFAGTAGSIGTTAMIGAAAIGSAVGSIASQAVGIATGQQQGFSWRGVAAGALSAGFAAGIGNAVGNVGTAVKAAMDGGSWLNVAKVAGAHALGGAAANVLSGGSFSWRSVAANAVGSVASAATTNAMFGTVQLPGGTGGILSDTATGLVGGIVSAHTRKAFGVGGVNEGRIALDAFGNALGNALIRSIESAHLSSEIDRQIKALHERTRMSTEERMKELVERSMHRVDAMLDARIEKTANDMIAKTAEKMTARDIPMPSMAPLERMVAAVAAERERQRRVDAYWNERNLDHIRAVDQAIALPNERAERHRNYVAMRREEQRRLEAPRIAAQQYDRSPDRLMPGEFRAQWSDWQPVPKGGMGEWATLLGLGANAAVSTSGKYQLMSFGQNRYSHLNYVVSADGDDWYTPVGYFDLLSFGELKAEGVWTGMDTPKVLGASGGIVGRLTVFSGSERIGKSDWRLDYRLAQVYEITADAGVQIDGDRSEGTRRFSPEASASARVSVLRSTASLSGGRFDLGPLIFAPAGELQGDLGSFGGIVRTNNRFYGTGWRTQGRVGLSAAVGGAVTWDLDVQLNQDWINRNGWWLKYAIGGGQ